MSDEQSASVNTLSSPSHEDLSLTVSPVLCPMCGPKNVAPRAPYHATARHSADERTRFPNVNVLQTTAGTVPVTRRSGKSKSVEFRSACSHKIRKAVDDLSRQSVKKSNWARAYYNAQIEQGHGATRAYRALGNRWPSIIWKL